MRLLCAVFLGLLASALAKDCAISKKSNSKLFCYYSKLTDIDGCYCSYVILPADSDVKSVERAKEANKGMKVLVTVNKFNQGLIDLLKTSKVDGLEIKLEKLDSKNDISDFISTIRTKLGSELYLAVSVPSSAEILAKYYDFKSLSKHSDVFILQTAFLGASKNVTFHPSRLSGLWDMQNTDSIVDLVSGLGAPLSKMVIAAPVQAFRFTLQNEEYSAPSSPALELKSITRDELCKEMKSGSNWTLERDQDQAGPYIFSQKTWIAFEDPSSIDIKAKYSRVRGLAGLALKDLSQDGGQQCGKPILEAAFNGLSRQARAPRRAVLHSLERNIQENSVQPFQGVNISPFRITRVIDTEGHWHVIRQDTRTEFTCSRQGYFVHPRSCNRFYRCVKFDQLSDEYSVFEFDCPAGLAFDERVEVCVWPGSLPQGQPCAGSSEIAPVPRQKFTCPHEPGYYADPENCRWFFACLDHGKSALEAYEFRCPFGLVFDSEHLLCEWPWLVPRCAQGASLGINLVTEYHYGGPSLSQYDGFGTLGVVKLGGVTGKIEQPLIFSNVGVGSYQNVGLGGLGAKATQSLYNAGLLKGQNLAGGSFSYVNNGIGSGISANGYNVNTGSHNINKASGDGADGILGGVNINNGAGEIYNAGRISGISRGGYNLNTVHGLQGDSLNINKAAGAIYNAGQYSGGVSEGKQYTGNFGNKQLFGSVINIADLSTRHQTQPGGAGIYQNTQLDNSIQTNNQYHGNVGVDQSNDVNFDYQGGIAYNEIGKANGNTGGLAHSYQTINQAYNQNDKTVIGNALVDQEDVKTNLGGSAYNNLGNINTFGAKYAQTYNQGIAGNINIIGGGYSAVGQSSSAVEVTNIVDGLAGISQSTTVSPISVSTYASVPTVTSVPIPAINTAAGFESYNGGVVANIPGLQYKIHGETGLANVSSGYVNFISSTIPTLVKGTTPVSIVTQTYQNPLLTSEGFAQDSLKSKIGGGISYNYGSQQYDANGGYVYSRPTVAFKEDVNQKYDSNGGYVYQKPNVAFVDGFGKANENVYQNVQVVSSTVKPIVTFDKKTIVQPTVSVEHGGGYIYAHPSIPFEAAPLKPVTGYTFSTPAPFTVKKVVPVQPAIQVQPVVTPKPVVPLQPLVSFKSEIPVQPIASFQPVTPIQSVVQPAVSTYNYVSSTTPQPVLAAEEQPVQPLVNNVVVTSHSDSPTVKPVVVQQPQVYVSTTTPPAYSTQSYEYHQPIIPVQKVQPKIISKFYIRKPVQQTYVQPAVSTYAYEKTNNFEGYTYEKPAVGFKESPLQPVVQQQALVQPAVVSSYFYQKPSVTRYSFKDVIQKVTEQPIQPVVIPQQPVISTYVPVTEKPIQPIVITENPIQPVQPVIVRERPIQPIVSTYQPVTEKPIQLVQPIIIPERPIQPAVVSSYYYQKPAVTSYTYKDVVQRIAEKPIQPVVSSYVPVAQKPVVFQPDFNYVVSSTPRPFVVATKKPAIVSSYSYIAPSTPKPEIAIQQENIEFKGYDYPKPTATFVAEPKPLITTFETKHTGQSYNVHQQNVQFQGYDYPKSAVTFVEDSKPLIATYENRQPVEEVPFIKNTAYVTGQQQQNIEFRDYDYPKPSVTFAEVPKPIVPTYENRQPIEEVPFVKKTAYVTGQSYNIQQQSNVEFQGYDYPKPSVTFVEQPKSIVTTYEDQQFVDEVPFVKKKAYIAGQTLVKQNIPSKPIIIENYVAPFLKENTGYEASAYSQANANANAYNEVSVISSTPKPTFLSTITPIIAAEPQPATEKPNFYFYDSRLSSTSKTVTEGHTYPKPNVVFEEKPIVTTTYLPPPSKEYLPVSTTTSKPIVRYSFSSLDEQYQYSTPSTPLYEPVKVTTPVPTYVVPEVSVPVRTYLPSRSKIRFTTPQPIEPEYLSVTPSVAPVEVTTLSREYLPVRSRVRVTPTTGGYLDLEDVDVTSRRPVKVVKVVRPIKTIIKQNDLIPMLGAKLGAQCTCTSNSLNLRKKQRIIVVEEDDDDDDGYVVANDGQGGTVIEDYKYEPQKVIDITPSSQIYIKSTTEGAVVPAPTYSARSRVRVRPATEAIELFAKQDYSEAVDSVSDTEIASAVRTGLKLVKAAAKEGAKEGVEEVINNRVRETIECQRAGLFRHPNQCNKFYSCKWDCRKNKYVLHTFNCPIHLTFDNSLGACNWPSQGPACTDDTLLPVA